MVTLEPTRRFLREFGDLPAQVQAATEQKLAVLALSPRHPSLRLKRVRGTEATWEISVTMQYRVTLMFAAEDHIILRRVGTHAILSQP